ncbi:hypothetical protein HDR63_02900 [bacterium]|nr:hypothetical protein [bacterium]
MLWIYMTHRSRHLFRRVYIGATYKFKRAKYDWNVSPWMVPCENQPDIQDRLMYIYLTKGIWYGDFDRSSNIINGRIVDLGTLSQHGMSLNRREIDIVKKLFFLMRTRCRDELLKKMDSIIQTDPHIIQYMIKRLSGYPSFANQCNLMRSYYEQSQKGREKS